MIGYQLPDWELMSCVHPVAVHFAKLTQVFDEHFVIVLIAC